MIITTTITTGNGAG
ncbi:thr operon leader peptide [Erwinia amylovora]